MEVGLVVRFAPKLLLGMHHGWLLRVAEALLLVMVVVEIGLLPIVDWHLQEGRRASLVQLLDTCEAMTVGVPPDRLSREVRVLSTIVLHGH